MKNTDMNKGITRGRMMAALAALILMIVPISAQAEAMTAAMAEERALSDAGLTRADVTLEATQRDKEYGQDVFDVEFTAGDMEYEYEISAADGTVLARQHERIAAPESGTSIGRAAAYEKALAHAGVAMADVAFMELHMDRDDGFYVYDIEIRTKDAEYDYEIEALTGNIVDFDTQTNAGGTRASTENFAGEDAAYANALKDAGIAAASIIYSEKWLDYDDGKWVYDIELRTENGEYDYEIDAVSGKILERDSKRADKDDYDDRDDDRYDDDHYDDDRDDDDRYDDDRDDDDRDDDDRDDDRYDDDRDDD